MSNNFQLRRGISRQALLALLALGAFFLLSGNTSDAGAAPTAVSEFSSGLSGRPHDIVAGPDGNMWFNVFDEDTRAIGRVKPDGTITEFSKGLNGAPSELVVGPDGNLWFGASHPPGIGRIDTTGEITMFSAGIRVNTNPNELAVGPEGNIWFASTSGSRPAVGRVTTEGKITQFDLAAYPSEIVAGPDGNMWMGYGEGASAAIGRIASTEASTTITLFKAGLGANSRPEDIVVGSDGDLWFIDPPEEAIGRVTPSGTITEFAKGIANSLKDIVAGPGGDVWFSAGIGQVTTAGAVTSVEIPGSGKGRRPNRIVMGAEGNLWFTATGEPGSGAVGRVTPSGSVTEFLAGINSGGQPSEIVVGPDNNLWFTDPGEPYAIGRIVPGDDEQGAKAPPSPIQILGPAPRPSLPGRLLLARRKVQVRAGRSAILSSVCVGGSHCAGRFTLSAKQVREGRNPVWRVLGMTHFSLAGGAGTQISIKLNGWYRRLLSGREHLSVTLTISGPTMTLRRSQRMNIRLVPGLEINDG